MPQPLSSKEGSLFRQVIRNYESKQYKKGLKAADQILRKNPNHGDTLAMKALIINAQGTPEEAFKLAKIALQNDMKSHVCWHVYGLLYRNSKNFEEAIKAYKFALKLEPESQQIQRDLALLQVQMRDYQGYITSRRTMLQARPALRQNWTALAVANHLAEDLTSAENVLTTYEETLKTPPSKNDMEHAEALLYKNSIIAEMGETERALEHLEAVSKYYMDKTSVMEMKANYLLKLGRKEAAEKAFRDLIDRNSDKRSYYEGLEQSIGDSGKGRVAFKPIYDGIAAKHPRADAPRRIPLNFLEGEDFKQTADVYLRRMLTKGVPSTFANIRALYADESKRAVIFDLVSQFASSTENAQTNGTKTEQANGDSSKLQTSALYFLAQHYNYHLSRDLKQAMIHIDKAIEREPESVDFHMTKARIWKHLSNPQKASETMEKARSLDERDRYINSKAAKYQLRNTENDTALKTMSKFTRNEATGGPLGDLHDMQCVWYITEDGEAYLRQGQMGLALKRFTSIYDIFDTWQDDQFDFHSFSLRKGQIRAYVEMVKWEDHLREHPFYSRAAISAIKAYMLLYQKPHLANPALANGHNGTASNEADVAERKKALKKAKREQQKQEKADAAKKEEKKTSTGGTNSYGEVKKEDTDPLGTQLAETKEPLNVAMKFLAPLLEFSPKNIEAQTVGFEVFLLRKKYLLALKCLLGAAKVDPEDPILHEQIIRFKQTLDSLPADTLPPKASTVITSGLNSLLKSGTSPTSLNDAFLSRHTQSPRHIIGGLRARNLIAPKSQAEHEKRALAAVDLPEANTADAKEAMNLLKQWGARDSARDLRKRARERWSETTWFEGGEAENRWWASEV
ncbi:MAG: hypothetical protein M4579_003717 [Chaenotheca gracillima]|nr:MAG: hypothetical protein M4579_003717 [Chaenotheca gracillima]